MRFTGFVVRCKKEDKCFLHRGCKRRRFFCAIIKFHDDRLELCWTRDLKWRSLPSARSHDFESGGTFYVSRCVYLLYGSVEIVTAIRPKKRRNPLRAVSLRA